MVFIECTLSVLNIWIQHVGGWSYKVSPAREQVVSILETTGRKHGMEFEPASLRTSVSCTSAASAALCNLMTMT